MEKLIQILDKIIALETDALEIKPRITNTIGTAVKILTAAKAANLGNTERAVVERLLTVATNAQSLVG